MAEYETGAVLRWLSRRTAVVCAYGCFAACDEGPWQGQGVEVDSRVVWAGKGHV